VNNIEIIVTTTHTQINVLLLFFLLVEETAIEEPTMAAGTATHAPQKSSLICFLLQRIYYKFL